MPDHPISDHSKRGPHGIRGEAHRPLVTGRDAMVCSGHPLATQAGLSVLQRGGSAFDAALTVAAALNVVEPQMSGMGGDGFIMIYDGATRQARVMNATGPAPARATRAEYLSEGIPMHGIRSVSVPGLVAGWLDVHASYGRLNRRAALAPAIDLAGRGFPVSQKLAAAIAGAPALAEFPSSRAIFTRDGRPLGAGEMLVQSDLAESFERIASEGAAAFYHGSIAAAIDACSRSHGGLISCDDLAAYRPRWQEPIATAYRGHRVLEAPPNSSGHVLLQMLGMLESFDLPSLPAHGAEAIHLMVEAKRLAFADREAYLADPDFVDVPIDGLLSREYARERADSIDRRRAATRVFPGEPAGYRATRRRVGGQRREDTTCFAVADGEGNAVCQLQSLQSGFGSALVVPGTGILLNNRMTYWHLDPDHVDCLEPGKRVRHTMNPVMVLRDDRPFLVLGTPGADTQVQSNLQVITLALDAGFAINEAVEAPRWRHLQDGTESTVPHTCPDELLLESRFPTETADDLRDRGHPVRLIGPWEATGSMMMIQIDHATGALFGAADPRRDGYAAGW